MPSSRLSTTTPIHAFCASRIPPKSSTISKFCTIAHIACHGETDDLDPMKSQLLFRDHGKATMSVQTLIDTQCSDCQLVYLSACESTVNQDADLLDEGIHVSGGFQMAGVPNTISTWWTVLDDECVGIAKAFYQGLVTTEMDTDVRRCAKKLAGGDAAAERCWQKPIDMGRVFTFRRIVIPCILLYKMINSKLNW